MKENKEHKTQKDTMRDLCRKILYVCKTVTSDDGAIMS